MTLHMIKLVVGADSVEALQSWRRESRRRGEADWRVRTRQTPKRAAELVEGGSIYRVIKGVIQCRQAILKVETVGEGAAARCEIVVDPELVRVEPTPRRPFQGWRYLDPKDAPADIVRGSAAESAPMELVLRLKEIGAW